MFGANGSLEQFYDFVKKVLIYAKDLQKALNAFGSALKAGKKLSAAFREAIRGGSN